MTTAGPELGFRMHAEKTPNPNSVKWVLGQDVIDAGAGVRSANFETKPSDGESRLAAAVFGASGVESVFLGPNFVTVTKREELEWTALAQPIVEAIKAWASSGEPALGPDFEVPEANDDDATVTRIRQILDDEIAPYVAQDGGEITFAGFRDGIVEVYLRGACAGCPSSTITLKVGIESRLKQELPEVQKVVAL